MMLEKPALDRPFYFHVVFWGERFRKYFLEYCLPSMLAPGNIPSVSARQPSKFLIATRPDDWEAIAATPLFQKLKRYVTPVFVEIPACPPDKVGCEHMGIGHQLCCTMTYADKAYAILLTPDSMQSDGTVRRLDELAKEGKKVVLAAALRFGEEPFLGILRQLGVIPDRSRASSGEPLNISGAQMAFAAINGFHSETLRYEWEAPYFQATKPAATWWRATEDGIILHSLSWAPLLLDLGSLTRHDTWTLENWTLDGDYVYRNFGRLDDIYIVQDSDDAFIASWSPLADRPQSLMPVSRLERWWKGFLFHDSFYSQFYDPLKQRIFFLPVRWHSQPIDDRWPAREREAMRRIRTYVTPPGSAPIRLLFQRGLAGALRPVTALLHVVYLAKIWKKIEAKTLRRIKAALHGNRAAQRYVIWGLRITVRQILGMRSNLPRPEIPPDLR